MVLACLEKEVLKKHGVTAAQLRSRRRDKTWLAARWNFIRLASAMGCSAAAIGRHIDRDHSSVLHALKRMRKGTS